MNSGAEQGIENTAMKEATAEIETNTVVNEKESISVEEVEQTIENPNAKLAEPQESNAEEESSEGITESVQEEVEQELGVVSTEELETLTMVVTEKPETSKTAHWITIGIALILMIAGMVCLLVMRRKNKYMSVSNQNEINNLSEHSSNTSVKLMDTVKTCPVKIASIHGVGKRSAQQDSFGISEVKKEIDFEQKGVLAVVADGMGGLSDGDRVSQMTVVTMLQEFDKDTGNIPASSLLLKLVHDANVEVCDYLGEDKLGKCGSTLTAVIVKDRKLSWISVGDSHIYVCRKDKLVKMNQDHNYAAELDEMVRNGEMSYEEAMGDPQRAALTSFIGMGELELVDQNENPIILEKGDRILLMSDGIYGSVSEQRIVEIMNMSLLSSCRQIEMEIKERNKRNQDNYTCVILEVK